MLSCSSGFARGTGFTIPWKRTRRIGGPSSRSRQPMPSCFPTPGWAASTIGTPGAKSHRTPPTAVFPRSSPPSASPTTRKLAARFRQEGTPIDRKAKLCSGRWRNAYWRDSALACPHQRPPPPRYAAPGCDQVLATHRAQAVGKASVAIYCALQVELERAQTLGAVHVQAPILNMDCG